MMGSVTNPGLIPHVSDVLFHIVRENVADRIVTVEAAYLEIYNEKIFDLLNSQTGTSSSPDATTALRLREDPKTGVFVDGQVTRPVASFKDVVQVIDDGLRKRTVASTNMNIESSRSHSVRGLSVVPFPRENRC